MKYLIWRRRPYGHGSVVFTINVRVKHLVFIWIGSLHIISHHHRFMQNLFTGENTPFLPAAKHLLPIQSEIGLR